MDGLDLQFLLDGRQRVTGEREVGLVAIEREIDEQRIIADYNELKQPDKVWLKDSEVIVIDFKTGKRQDKDLAQISAYAQLLNEIFKLPVRAVLYYAQLDLFLDL